MPIILIKCALLPLYNKESNEQPETTLFRNRILFTFKPKPINNILKFGRLEFHR